MPSLRIAVCEDIDDEMDRLIHLIQISLSAQSRAYSISRFQTGSALLKGYHQGLFDILLIDMYLGDALGIEIAKQIRKSDQDCHIVFVTQSPDFALDSYAVHAAHYLIKPVTSADIEEVWRRCLTPLNQDENCITLMIDRKPKDIRLADILFIEADNKRCLIHTLSETLSTRVPIDQLEYMLATPAFCRCHRGYLVNLEHVSCIDKDFIMSNGATAYIRQSDLPTIRRLYQSYLQDNPATN